MKRLLLSFASALLYLGSAGAQSAPDSASTYTARKLHIDEINFVSGYYWQDGNNSAVTGGIGSEQLTDFANNIELKLLRTDRRNQTHTITAELGVDAYSSASSDKIDPNTISSASRSDKRIYPTLSYGFANANKDLLLGGSVSYSTEYDYKSYGIGVNAAKLSGDKNRELSLRAQVYFDTWKVIYPIELRTGGMYSGHDGDYQPAPRNSFSGSLAYSQVFSKRFQMAFLIDGVYQHGLLATRYQRVYFSDLSHNVENLPDSRLKIPLGVRASYFLGSRFVLRGFYRYYTDNWGVRANTLELEVPVKITPFVSITPHYRFYNQTAADYFAPYAGHQQSEQYYTSDYDLSRFTSHFFGAGVRLTPEKGVLGIAHWTMLELRYGHYVRSNGLTSNIISLNARFR